jgi:hypothetical protein
MNPEFENFECEDKGNYILVKSVPLFDAHDDDDIDISFDKERLEKIVNNNNRRIADTGDKSPLIPGHQNLFADEESCDILGYGTNYHIKDFGNVKPRPTIHADLEIPKENLERVRKLPRRSIELLDYMDEDNAYIDCIALLGHTTPARSLGLLKKNNKPVAKYSYELNVIRSAMDREELKTLIKECMAEAEQAKACAKNDDEEEPLAQSAEDDKDKDKENDKMKNAYEQERRRYSRLENENKAMQARLAELEKTSMLAQRKADLIGVEAEGFIFDINDELDAVSEMDAKSYAKHLERMRKNYSKAPIGSVISGSIIKKTGSVRHDVVPLIPSAAADGSVADYEAQRQMTARTEKIFQAAQKLVNTGKFKNIDDALTAAREEVK